YERSARSAGGLPVKSGKKFRADKPVDRREAQILRDYFSSHHGDFAGRKKLKRFSEFDSYVGNGTPLTASDAANQATEILCSLVEHGYRGIRPQLAYILLLVARLAKHDGYSLRVVADTAILAMQRP